MISEQPIDVDQVMGNGQGIPDFGGPECGCKMCHNYRARGKDTKLLNHGPYKPVSELAEDQLNRVSLPGDIDYQGYVGQGITSGFTTQDVGRAVC